MKQKLGGQAIDVVSGDDLKEAVRGIQDWMVSVARGVRPIRFSTQGVANAAGIVEVGGNVTLTGGQLGPEVGAMWAICRLTVRIDGQPAAYSMYVNGPHTNSLIRDVAGDANGYAGFGAQECLIMGGETLYIRGTSLTPSTGVCTVSGLAIEVPNQLMWKWLAG